MKKLFVLLTILILILAGCSTLNKTPSKAGNNKNQTYSPTGEDQQKGKLVDKKFTITGFTWASCAQTAQAALAGLDGVKEVRVETSGATVITYDSSKVNMGKIKEILAKYNYGVK